MNFLVPLSLRCLSLLGPWYLSGIMKELYTLLMDSPCAFPSDVDLNSPM